MPPEEGYLDLTKLVKPKSVMKRTGVVRAGTGDP